jgi:hypothetical protein
VIFTPPIAPADVRAAQLLRLLRLLRLLKLAQVARRLTADQSVRFAAILALMTALGGGAAFASVEGKQVSTWDGIWWAVSTMTTVGYGDLYPTTTAGWAIAIIVMLVGIGFIAILTAAVAQKFVVAGVTTEIDTAELETEYDIETVEAHVLGELHDLQSRLGDLEVAVRRMAEGHHLREAPTAKHRSEELNPCRRPPALGSTGSRSSRAARRGCTRLARCWCPEVQQLTCSRRAPRRRGRSSTRRRSGSRAVTRRGRH